MPEGDTVWLTARTLDRRLSGHELTRCDLRVPDLATVDLTGERVHSTVSRGKHLLTRIGTLTLHTHLKMEGSWHLVRDGGRWRRPAHQARVILGVPGWQAVGFSLGIVELIATSDEASVVGHLGPDLLGPDWDEDEAVRRLGLLPTRPVLDALLDQRNLAGVGNMYALELCFLAGVHPETPVGAVPDLRRLASLAHRVLVANRDRPEQTTTGSLRRGEERWVYRRDRQRCRRCGTPIAVAMRGTPGRASYWCPSCQPVWEGDGHDRARRS